MSRTLFLDVETPNRRNNRICALGVIVEENGEIIYQCSQLINPEVEFDDINIDIHGICPADVKDAPTFPEIWGNLREYFISSIIVGHNVTFDLSVLEKTLNAYDLMKDSREVEYECTLLKSRQLYSLSSYRLDEVCNYLGIELDKHHDALCDAKAAMDVYKAIAENTGWNNFDIHTKYFTKASAEHVIIKRQKFSDETVAIQALKDILSDIISDGIVSEKELYSLKIWMEQIGDLKEKYPFNKISDLILQVLSDGQVSPSENDALIQKFNVLLNPVSCKSTFFEPTTIDINGKTCCITGNCTSGSRSQIENRIAEMGGIPVETVTKKTQVLIVGGEGNTAWAYGNYGTKVKKALQYQSEGLPIIIVGEKEVFGV